MPCQRYLVKYELDEIKWSRWEDAFSTIRAGPFPTKIRLFFGKNDYWVANDLRDAFIAKHCSPESNRGALDVSADIDPSEDGDEESVVIPHDFSISECSISETSSVLDFATAMAVLTCSQDTASMSFRTLSDTFMKLLIRSHASNGSIEFTLMCTSNGNILKVQRRNTDTLTCHKYRFPLH